MVFTLRRPRLRPIGATSLVALLVLALVLAAFLAYQALMAGRSHRRAAEQVMREYAALAAWEFERHVTMTLTAIQMTTFVLPVKVVEAADGDADLPTPEAFAETARLESAWCACLDSARTFYRLDLRDGTLAATGEAPGDAMRQWIQELAASSPEVGLFVPTPPGVGPWNEDEPTQRSGRSGASPPPEPPKPPEPTWPPAEARDRAAGQDDVEFGIALTTEDRRSTFVYKGPRITLRFGTISGRPRAVAQVVVSDRDGRPLAVYGIEVPPTALVRPVFERIVENTALLPPFLVDGVPGDSILAIEVADRDGNVIFRSAEDFPTTYVAADTLTERYDELVVRAAIRPHVANALVIGGLPRSRLPLIVLLLGLTAALIVAALVQLRRQQQLARLRSDFISGVSHELRTPLAQIRLFAELLDSGRLRTDEEWARSVRVIDQEARRLTHLVENVLQFSRGERGRTHIAPERTDLASLAREVLEAFGPLARARGVEIVAELVDGIVADVDAGALRQVLLNLLDNAVKYGPAGQRVRLGLARVGDRVRVEVDDRGPGVPPEDRERIWEPYLRLERDAASATGGSGIGLSVVRTLVELHGGRCRVEDAPGGGARFVVELPLATWPSDVPAPREASAARGEADAPA